MKFFNKVKRLASQIKGFFPSALPVGMAELENWASSIEETYNLPTKDKNSVRFTLTTAIMHLGPTTAYKSKFYFVMLIRAACAKQIAGAKFHEIKLESQKKAAEVTAASSQVTSDGPKQ